MAEAGIKIGTEEDLSTENERILGRIVKAKVNLITLNFYYVYLIIFSL